MTTISIPKSKINSSNFIIKAISYLLLGAFAVAMITPFIWMIGASFKTPEEILSPAFFPNNIQWANYEEVLSTSGMLSWYKNTVMVALISTISVAFFCSLTGYTLAKYKFPLKRLFFLLIISTMMIPTEMLIIPWYIMSVDYGWVNTIWGVAFPGVITAGGVFLMQQFMGSVPDELLDSGRMDGLSEFGLYSRIAMPLSMAAVGALCIFNFLGNWNAFLWPLIVTSDRSAMTLPVGMMFFANEQGFDWELTMTTACLSILPLLFVAMFFQRYIIEGIQITGLKG